MPGKNKFKLYLNALRLERWPRSLAIIPGFVAFLLLDPAALSGLDIPAGSGKLLLAFVLTLFISTANYIINEIADAPYDAHHPAKKDRPLVKKEISSSILLVLWLLLVALSLAVATFFFRATYFRLDLTALLLAGILYNVPPIRMKDIPFLDSTLESANNPIRFLIGWHILGQTFPPLSLLVSWWAFGNFLMVGKRVAEKKFLSAAQSSAYRLSLKRYSAKQLFVFMVFNGLLFLATFALFAVEVRFYTLLLSLPFILVYLLMFMKKSTQDIHGAEEPEKLLKNPYFAVYTLFLAIILLLAYLFK